MKTLKITFCLLFFCSILSAQQKFLTKSGYTSFFSSAPVEDIEADNNQVLSIVDTSTGTIAISILMKSFMFEKSLMQEHFNENYVESDKFPKATFKGKILDFDTVGSDKKTVSIKGNLTIHGVTKPIETQAVIHRNDQEIVLKGSFPVTISEYGIEIPSVVVNNIAETVKVSFELNHKHYKR